MKNKNSDVESLFGVQPSSRQQIAMVDNASSLTEYEYEFLRRELNTFYSRKKPYYNLPKNNEEIDWPKPRVTRTKDELYAQLRFYDVVKTKERLTIKQLEEINREVKQIYSELLQIDGYEYFLKYGHEKLRIDKLNKWEDPRNIRFYQREMDIIYDNTINEYVNIILPIEKWWITEDDLKKRSDFSDPHKQFVDIEAKQKVSSYDVEPIEVLNNDDRVNEVIENDDTHYEQRIDTIDNNKKEQQKDKKEKGKYSFFKKKNKREDKESKEDKVDEKQQSTSGASNQKSPPPAPQPSQQFPQKQMVAFPPPSPNNVGVANNFAPKSGPTPGEFPPPTPNGSSVANNFGQRPMTLTGYSGAAAKAPPPPMQANAQKPQPVNKQFFDYQK